MPYINGKRVTPEEWQAAFGSTKPLHTGPSGENPATAPELDETTGAPEVKSKSGKAGGKRSKRSEAAAKAAVADALGVKKDSPKLADIDVSGLDAAPADDSGDTDVAVSDGTEDA